MAEHMEDDVSIQLFLTPPSYRGAGEAPLFLLFSPLFKDKKSD